MASHVYTGSVLGLEAHLIDIETDISPGLGSFTMVGLPDAAVKEAKERVRSGIKHLGIAFPRTRVTQNLAPADVRKTGTHYDLPITLGILAAHGSLKEPLLEGRLYAGELSLDGKCRGVAGALPLAILAKEHGFKELVIPAANAEEASLVDGLTVIPIEHLSELIEHMAGVKPIRPYARTDRKETHAQKESSAPDFKDIRGQQQAKRALEIAAAGGHNLLMQGPPGSGKTLLARSFASILPAMTKEEMLEVTRIHSVVGADIQSTMLSERPFRAPHHSASAVSLIGGGSAPMPGEISLAHRGVLFLDEILEFPRHVLETLRQPLESGTITVSRASGTCVFPARCMLIGAMNPCPCGYFTDREKTCTCTPSQLLNYRRKLSGPLLDRLDLCIEVPKVETGELLSTEEAEPSERVRERIERAREIQRRRYLGSKHLVNAELSHRASLKEIRLAENTRPIVEQALQRLQLSARGYFRMLKVSRTIADLAGHETVLPEHVLEALQFRFQSSPEDEKSRLDSPVMAGETGSPYG